MIDIILFIAMFGVFYGGFWCGAKFKTMGEMLAAAKSALKSALN